MYRTYVQRVHLTRGAQLERVALHMNIMVFLVRSKWASHTRPVLTMCAIELLMLVKANKRPLHTFLSRCVFGRHTM